ncbi:MAG: L-arabinose isomerase [Candidatus Planktophila sp.]|nr:L-arabinose isomerase [Candidatus Planktophila sp.]
MLDKQNQLEIWFLTGSQSLYGEEVLLQVAKQSQNVVNSMNESPSTSIRIVWKPVLTTAEDIKKTCMEASSNPNCIGVITWMHTFSPAKMWIAGLNALQVPLLHFHTQINSELPWESLDMDFMNLNQAAHGDREHGHIQARLNLPRKIIAGHESDPQVMSRIGNWIRAAVGWNEAQNLKLARFGDNMRYVAVTDGDKTSAQITLGVSIEAYGINELCAAVDRVAEDSITALVAEYEELYEVSSELVKGGARHSSLRYQAAIEIALEKFLIDGGFSAFTTNFEDLGNLKQLPGLAVQRLMAKGYGFGGEGDWKTSALLRIIKSMTQGLVGGSSFMEDYTYHFGPGEPKVLGAHMLEVCPTITDQRPKCEIHPLGIGGKDDPVRLVFNATPAHGCVVGLMDLGGRFRILSNDIEVVKPDKELKKLPVASAVWKPKPSLALSAESWIFAGGSHHTVLSTSLEIETLNDFANILNIEHLHISDTTVSQSFQDQIKWNGIYFKLSTTS